MSVTPNCPHVALIVETSTAYGRRILRGITRFRRSERRWSVFFEEHELWTPPPKWLARWKGDGIICRATTPQLAKLLGRRGIPTVDLNDQFFDLGLPSIRTDHVAAGRLGAKHFLERGFRNFGFYGYTDSTWAAREREGFLESLTDAGFDCDVYESPQTTADSEPWESAQEKLGRWLTSLPKPVAVMACNDSRGHKLLDACGRMELAVPEVVAVLGGDDDELLCQQCDPPLSSIVPGAERIGYEAAALLARLMAGRSPSNLQQLIAPLHVQIRQSTDILAIDDPDVATAVRYIRQHACDGATVRDVLREVSISRSQLERRYRKFLGRSPQADIREARLGRVKQLLAESDLTLERIAELAGFKHTPYMSVVFKREVGQTLGEYRRDTRGKNQ